MMKLTQDFINGLMILKQKSSEINKGPILKEKERKEIIEKNLMEIEISNAINHTLPEDTNFSLD